MLGADEGQHGQPGAAATEPSTQEPSAGEAYLNSLINKTLRVLTTDSRMFVGTFKCTDANRNVVLSLTHEYRQPTQQQIAEAAAKAGGSNFTADMSSRYMGLVVVPGEHIAKIEVEEFVSQMKNRPVPNFR